MDRRQFFFEVNVSIIKIEDGQIDVISGEKELYPDGKVDLCGVNVDAQLMPLTIGDSVRFFVMNPNKKVYKITPFWSLVTAQGIVTFRKDNFAIIDENEKHLCYLKMFKNLKLKLNDRVEVTSIRGDYDYGNTAYELRAIEINVISKRAEQPANPKRKAFNQSLCGPLKNYYDLPIALENIFDSAVEINEKLEQLLPKERLTMENYQKRMHDCIYLEEMCLRQAFVQYRIEEAVFQHVLPSPRRGNGLKNCFTLNFHLHNNDLRPSISPGI